MCWIARYCRYDVSSGDCQVRCVPGPPHDSGHAELFPAAAGTSGTRETRSPAVNGSPGGTTPSPGQLYPCVIRATKPAALRSMGLRRFLTNQYGTKFCTSPGAAVDGTVVAGWAGSCAIFRGSCLAARSPLRSILLFLSGARGRIRTRMPFAPGSAIRVSRIPTCAGA